MLPFEPSLNVLTLRSDVIGSTQILFLAEVLVGLATDTTVYLSRRGEALKANKLTFTIRASDSSWHPGLPGRPLFPSHTAGLPQNTPSLATPPPDGVA